MSKKVFRVNLSADLVSENASSADMAKFKTAMEEIERLLSEHGFSNVEMDDTVKNYRTPPEAKAA